MRIVDLYPYLCIRDAPRAIDFYVRAFGALTLMLSDEFPEFGIFGPQPGAPTPFSIHLHVDDADAVIGRAVEAGATLERAPEDAFYGERGGVVRCPFGHRWMIGHQIEYVSPEEMQRRYTRVLAG